MIQQNRKYTFWLTGLPSSGKTTLGGLLKSLLEDSNIPVVMIDGDEVRKTICNDLGYSEKDRKENIRRVATLAKTYNDSGNYVICCFVSPTNEIREIAKKIIGIKNFYEIFIDAPLEICEARDIKGLYKKARLGLIADFTGISALFESPISPDLHIRTDIDPIQESFKLMSSSVFKRISKAE